MKKLNILVTGANSQLGKTLRKIKNKNYKFDFQEKSTLNITKKKELKRFFQKNTYDYCINFAAYTDVNKAENFPEKALKVNTKGVENLAKAANKYNFTLIHISTDYVFDGKKTKPYLETDIPNPINKYGTSKFLGEQIIKMYLNKYFIIRTSWLYSPYNQNFVKTILKLSEEKEYLKLINDQQGTPTYAYDLIKFIIYLIEKVEKDTSNYYGTYHFSNKGTTTWYDFGKEILNLYGKQKTIIPINSIMFDTPAKRPAYSVLSKEKIKNVLAYKSRHWKKALEDFIIEYKK